MLTLTVPVIDLDAELCNWNKWLNVLHCITGPMIVVLLTEGELTHTLSLYLSPLYIFVLCSWFRDHWWGVPSVGSGVDIWSVASCSCGLHLLE